MQRIMAASSPGRRPWEVLLRTTDPPPPMAMRSVGNSMMVMLPG